MRWQSSNGASTCAYGVHGQAGFLFERQRSAMRQNAIARARAAPKRKLRDDDDDEETQHAMRHEEIRTPSVVRVDEFGNRVVLDGIKRLRVASPPPSTPASSQRDDVAMDENENGKDSSIVPVGTRKAVPTGGIVTPSGVKYGVAPVYGEEIPTDASCRVIVVFDPRRAMSVGRSPRIQLVEDDEAKSEDDSSSEENFVRFEELPDDDEEDAEAMELD